MTPKMNMATLPFLILTFVFGFLIDNQASWAGNVEVIAIRHGESINNVISQKKQPLSFIMEMYKQSSAARITGSIIQNPVLSTEGRDTALALHAILFPDNQDKNGLLATQGGKNPVVFYVSPLNRTIQTAVLVFKDQLFRAGVKMLANPNITEHRKSTSEEGFEEAERPNLLFNFELQNVVDKAELPRMEEWKRAFESSMLDCCNKKAWWPQESTESEASLSKRIDAFKKQLSSLPDNSRVIVVSHGTFLRTLFYGIGELSEKKYHLRNLGMIIAKMNKETGKWISEPACWVPQAKDSPRSANADESCFDKVADLDGAYIDKGPVYGITQSPPLLGSWQNRFLKIVESEGFQGVTWSETNHGGIKGAALIDSETDDCKKDIPVKYKKDRETACFVIKRVDINEKGPAWDKTSNTLEVLPISWDKSDEKVNQYLKSILKSPSSILKNSPNNSHTVPN